MRLAGRFRCVNGSKSMEGWKKLQMSDCNLLGNLDSVRRGNLYFQIASRWFCDQPGLIARNQNSRSSSQSSSAPAGLPMVTGAAHYSNGRVGTTSPHFTDEETGSWINTETCILGTPQPLYSLPCITELSLNDNLATLGMWYVSQASPATSYKSSNHFCISETLQLYLHYFTLIWPNSSPALPLILLLSHSPVEPLHFEWAKEE